MFNVVGEDKKRKSDETKFATIEEKQDFIVFCTKLQLQEITLKLKIGKKPCQRTCDSVNCWKTCVNERKYRGAVE